MGVPKFFRWLSERYPLINQPLAVPPKDETRRMHFPDYVPPTTTTTTTTTSKKKKKKKKQHKKGRGSSAAGADGDDEEDATTTRITSVTDSERRPGSVGATTVDHGAKCNVMPQFDRLYMDMNGIIHCCSHNNIDEVGGVGDDYDNDDDEEDSCTAERKHQMSQEERRLRREDEIMRNVCYYVDRIVGDIARPTQLVYIALDGVAPRAKLNQQRSRRYRSGDGEREIEATVMRAREARLRRERKNLEQQQLEEAGTGTGVGAMGDDYWAAYGFDPDGMVEAGGGGGVGSIGIGGSLARRSGGSGRGSDGRETGSGGPKNRYDHDDDGNDIGVMEADDGRFIGKFESPASSSSLSSLSAGAPSSALPPSSSASSTTTPTTPPPQPLFHSSAITPGSAFFERCTSRLCDFVQSKLESDPRWEGLTVIFNGPDVPGEGEHKIMDFIREQQQQHAYDPNWRHCLYGQDGDLIMLGLASNERNICLLREEVVFIEKVRNAKLAVAIAEVEADRDRMRATKLVTKGTNTKYENGMGESLEARQELASEEETEEGGRDIGIRTKEASLSLAASVHSYVHNPSFELLHISVLRDYLAYEFETSDVYHGSPYDLARTIDDFVFMTFFVGNDFLPHMPALDIADEAFDLLFFAYKRRRSKWLKRERRKYDRAIGDGSGDEYEDEDEDNEVGTENKSMKKGKKKSTTKKKAEIYPYLTKDGSIVSGSRLQSFLAELGRHEDPYYANKRRTEAETNERIRSADRKAGRADTIPSEEDLALREEEERERYRTMLESMVEEAEGERKAGRRKGSEYRYQYNGDDDSDDDDDDDDDDFDGEDEEEGRAWSMTSSSSSSFEPVVSSGKMPSLADRGRDAAEGAFKSKGETKEGLKEGNVDDDGHFRPESNRLEAGFLSRIRGALLGSIPGFGSGQVGVASKGDVVDGSGKGGRRDNEKSGDGVVRGGATGASSPSSSSFGDDHVTDLKGRYYYDKFGFTPIDAERHRALRRSYVEGLVWTLQYYYRGVPSWDWYYPYHYGPMLSDLVDLKNVLAGISFRDDGDDVVGNGGGGGRTIKKGEPLRPYEQLLGCLPPSSAHLLPEPYRHLMTDPASPIADFYPDSYTVDMNGKRWPWEAVVLLPFIDAARLIEVARDEKIEAMLTEEEKRRNQQGEVVVFEKRGNSVSISLYRKSAWCVAADGANDGDDDGDEAPVPRPRLGDSPEPLPGFPTLRSAPIRSLYRRGIWINVFGVPSRYRTAILQMRDDPPPLPTVEALGPKFVGTTVYFRYPMMQEGFVTAVSDGEGTVRGPNPIRKWTEAEAEEWSAEVRRIMRKYQSGAGVPGTGGWKLPPCDVTLSVRPFAGIEILGDGTTVKTYARVEVEVPMTAALYEPKNGADPRFVGLPSKLEKDPYRFGRVAVAPLSNEKGGVTEKARKQPSPKSGAKSTSARPGIKTDRSAVRAPLGSAGGKAGKANSIPRTATMNGMARFSSRQFCCAALSSSAPGPILVSPLTSVGNKLSSRRARPASRCDFSSSAATVDRTRRAAFARARTHAGPKTAAASVVVVAAASIISSVEFALAAPHRSHHLEQRCRAPKSFPPLLCSPPFLPTPFRSTTDGMQTSEEVMNRLRGGGGFGDLSNDEDYGFGLSPAPPLEFAHGTTTLSFIFQGGIIAAVDSRASIGNFVGSKTTQKVLPVNRHILGTMAGGAADCTFWIRRLRSEARLHELTEGRGITVARASKLLAGALYQNRGLGLSVGTMIMGFDDDGGIGTPSIYYVDDTGKRILGDMFSVGSGSTFALGILDTAGGDVARYNMTEEEAIALGIRAIRHATFRDAFSGGYIGVYLITRDGWKKVFSEDLALSGAAEDMEWIEKGNR